MKIALRATFIFAFLWLSTPIVYSCTCFAISHRKGFRGAASVFAGRVIEVTEDKSYVPPKLKVPPDTQKIIDSTKRYIIRFEIERKFKDVKGREIIIYDLNSDLQSSSSCADGLLAKGGEYIIYAFRRDDGLYKGGICSRTQHLDKASEEYKDLNSFWFRLKARLPWPS